MKLQIEQPFVEALADELPALWVFRRCSVFRGMDMERAA
jgi:hypothetical protein